MSDQFRHELLIVMPLTLKIYESKRLPNVRVVYGQHVLTGQRNDAQKDGVSHTHPYITPSEADLPHSQSKNNKNGETRDGSTCNGAYNGPGYCCRRIRSFLRYGHGRIETACQMGTMTSSDMSRR